MYFKKYTQRHDPPFISLLHHGCCTTRGKPSKLITFAYFHGMEIISLTTTWLISHYHYNINQHAKPEKLTVGSCKPTEMNSCNIPALPLVGNQLHCFLVYTLCVYIKNKQIWVCFRCTI